MIDFERVLGRGLVKMFGLTRALGGVDLELEAGTITVIEGPNGSGKSSLLNILAGLARPTRGLVRYGDHSGARVSTGVRARIGLLSHAAFLYPDLSGLENLEHFARLHEVRDFNGRVRTLTERFELGLWMDRPTRTYSRGQLQRVALARSVLHSPRLLLLDEPSTGLDVQALEHLVRATEQEREAGTIVAVVTHDAAFADRIGGRRVRLERGLVVGASPAGEGLRP